MNTPTPDLSKVLGVLEAELLAAKETLAWYADENNYEEWVPGQAFVERIQDAVWPNDTEREWEPDGGDRARTFLAANQTPAEADRDSLRLENEKLRRDLRHLSESFDRLGVECCPCCEDAEAELERLRSGIRSEVERLRSIAKYHFGSSDRATPGSPAATEYNQRAIEARDNADRLEALLEAEK